MISNDDEYFMRVALNYARRGLGFTMPNPSVGCAIVKNDVIVALGRTSPGGRPHAEAEALQRAGSQANGATAYVTLEPCAEYGRAAPCSEALIHSGVKRVVVACIDPNPLVNGQGIEKMRAAGLPVDVGVLESEARTLNEGFIKRVTLGRPHVTLKLAVSADGKIAARKGERTAISGELSSRYVSMLRSEHDSILVGIQTVLVDNPKLISKMHAQDHIMTRVILDTDLQTPPDALLFEDAVRHPVWIFHKDASVDKVGDLEGKGGVPIACSPVDLNAVLGELAKRGITRLLVEGGSRIAASFLKAGVVDEVQLVRAPHALGTEGVDALSGHKIDDLGSVFGFSLLKRRVLGEDLLEIYRRSP
jgi:diaminohydroxyphosphoribosylaminopyrimidine deaminase/5-amino-6-(5-phosphoribosylamino)uracil reductase